MRRIGWKHQIKPWVEAGYRVVAPDMLGYGGTDKPEDKEQYSLKSISNDLACILKNLEVDKAVSSDQVSSRNMWGITDLTASS